MVKPSRKKRSLRSNVKRVQREITGTYNKIAEISAKTGTASNRFYKQGADPEDVERIPLSAQEKKLIEFRTRSGIGPKVDTTASYREPLNKTATVGMTKGHGSARKPIVSKKPKLTYIRGESAVNAKGQKVLGKKREAELQKALKNYGRRTERKIKKYYGEVTAETIAKYARMMGEETVIISFDRAQIKNVRAYNTMIKFLNRDKTREFKAKISADRRKWLTATLEHAYDLSADEAPELFKAIEGMSGDQILSWATQNPEFVKKLFYQYDEVWDTETYNKWRNTVNELIDTLQPYTSVVIPKIE